jgi:uncharacterized membrane protein
LTIFELSGHAPAVTIDTSDFDGVAFLSNVCLVVVFEIFATELVAAAGERLVSNDLYGTPIPTAPEFLRRVPWGSLLLATLIYEVLVAVGLVLFVVPGVVVFALGVLYGPITVVERVHPFKVMKRSAQLVRSSFWRVFGLSLAAGVGWEVSAAGVAAALGPFGHVAGVTAAYALEVLLTPLFGIGVAVLYYALVELERARQVA